MRGTSRPGQWKVLGILFGMLALAFAVGCEGQGPKPANMESVKVGVIYPISGANRVAGQDLKAGIELAIEIVNRPLMLPIPLARGEGLPSHGNAKIEVLVRDSQGDPNVAADLVERLVKEDGVKAVIGCYSSTITAAASERAEMLGVPFVNPDSTSPGLTQKGLKWFFRTTPHDEMFAENFFRFLSGLAEKKKAEIPRRVILVYENRLWGTSVARAERKLALRYGYEVVEEIPYDSKKTDVQEELRKIKAALPAIILQASYDDDAVLFMKGYKGSGTNPAAILAMDAGFISPHFLQTLGRDGEFILSREVWALDLGRKKPLVGTVNDLFKKKFGKGMTGNSARSFTALITLAEAMERARTLDPAGIRESLLKTDIKGEHLVMPWDGVRFDPETGQNVMGKGIIVQVLEGQYRTVWPWELSASEVSWPMPSWSQRGVNK